MANKVVAGEEKTGKILSVRKEIRYVLEERAERRSWLIKDEAGR